MLKTSDIRADLKKLGLRRSDSVIVHSSFKSLGPVKGGPHAVIDALLETVGPEGALLFPNLYIPGELTTENPPKFDLKHESVRNLGIIPEIFKFNYAEHFSIHPTHSLMGVGAKAKVLLRGHEHAGYPCGPGTPWHRNAMQGGKILLIGVDQRRNTTYHCVEEHLENSYQLSKQKIEGTVIEDGKEHRVRSYLHVWGNRADFNIINEELIETGGMIAGCVGQAGTFCIDAGKFLELALAKIDKNPFYFLEQPQVAKK